MDRVNNQYYKSTARSSHVEIICKCGCGRSKFVRTADVKRGWGLFWSKSCKAKHQEKKTHQFKNYQELKQDDTFTLSPSDMMEGNVQ